MKAKEFLMKLAGKDKSRNERAELDRMLGEVSVRIAEIQKKIDQISADDDFAKYLSLDELRIVLIRLKQVVHRVSGGEEEVRKEFEKIRSVW